MGAGWQAAGRAVRLTGLESASGDMDMGFTPADRKASEVPEGGLRLAKGGRRPSCCCPTCTGSIYATSRTCPHAGAALN